MTKDLVRCDGCGAVATAEDMQKRWLVLTPYQKPVHSGFRITFGPEDDEPRFPNRHAECGGEFCSPRCVLAFCALYVEVVEIGA